MFCFRIEFEFFHNSRLIRWIMNEIKYNLQQECIPLDAPASVAISGGCLLRGVSAYTPREQYDWQTDFERNNSYYFSPANQQKVGTKIYSLTQCSLTVNECDWQILAGNDERIKSHCLTRAKDWTQVACLAVSYSNHYTRMFAVFVWDYKWILIIGGSKGGRQGRAPPWGPNSFIFMQFSAKMWKIIAILGVGAPPGENPGSATANSCMNDFIQFI